MDEKEKLVWINNIELHARNIRTELNELGRGLDILRREL